MKPENVTCYLPIETKARELDTKIYIALKLVEKGFQVVIGSKRGVHFRMLTKNKYFIYFDKGIYSLFWDFYNAIKFSKGLIVEIQEEANISNSFDKLISTHNNRCAELASLIFTWGALPKKIIEQNCPKLNKSVLKATGHPSFDLLHKNNIKYYYKLGKQNINYIGTYILVNTNFGHYNGYINYNDSRRVNSNLKDLYNNHERKKWTKIEKFQKKIIKEFIKMIIALSKSFPDKKIVVRPHPVERLDYYENSFKKFNNVDVIRKGSAREWIVNAESIIHYDCSTGIESLIAGKNVISFCPYYNEDLVVKMPIDVSIKIDNKDDLIAFIKNNYQDHNHNIAEKKRKQLLSMKKVIENIEKDATNKIVISIEEICNNWNSVNFVPLKRIYYLVKYFINWQFIPFIKKIYYKLINSNNIKIREKSKFPYLNKSEIEERLNIWYEILSLKKQINVYEVSKNTFLFKPKDY